jgi:hypothetical protein
MGVPSFTGVNTMFPEKPEKVRPRAKRFGVEFEEERAWVSFYRRVRHDATLATEVLAQLEADAEMKRTHLALLCCGRARSGWRGPIGNAELDDMPPAPRSRGMEGCARK